MAKVTESGVEIERLDQIIAHLSQGFRHIYGQEINLEPDTPDGQLIGIFAQMKADLEEFAENVYKQLDPDLATGAWLEQRVAYAGLVRRRAEFSYLRSVILTGEPFTPLYKGIVVSDLSKQRWILTKDVVLNQQGSARADFRSEHLGAFSSAKNTALTIETVTLGLFSAMTSEDAEVGVEEESDIKLRQRFFQSRSKNASNSVEAILGEIQSLPDVRQVKVLENLTASVDAQQVQPHSINVIVTGGLDADIANVIYENKGAGAGLQGNTRVTLQRAGLPRVIQFDRPTPVDIQVAMHLVRDVAFTEIDQQAIKQQLTQLPFDIGESVQLSRLYSPINQVSGFWVKSLKIARVGDALSQENISLNIREIARIPLNQIQIEVE